MSRSGGRGCAVVDGDRIAGGQESQRRRGCAALLAALLAPVLLVPAGPPAAAATSPCRSGTPADVDGAGPDVVLGLPSYDLPGKRDAGALLVLSDLAGPGEPLPGRVARRTLVTAADVGLVAQAGARFGAAVLVVRRSGEDCADLVVGAPGADVAGLPGAGRVHVLPGTPRGLGPPRESLDESRWPGLGGAQAGAGFGSALAADGAGWLAVGVPRRDVAGRRDAGRVVRLDRRLPGAERVDVVQQGGGGAGAPETGDRFGEVLHAVGALGARCSSSGCRTRTSAPGWTPGRSRSPSPAGRSRSSPRTRPAPAAPRRPGTATARPWAAGRPRRADTRSSSPPWACPGRTSAGPGTPGWWGTRPSSCSPPRPPASGRCAAGRPRSPRTRRACRALVEADDRFGAAVLSVELGLATGRRHLVVGAPGEDLGGVADAGLVTTSRVDVATGATLAGSGAAWSQDAPGVAGRAERGDRFGAALAAVLLAEPPDDEDPVPVLLVTVPGEDAGTVGGAGQRTSGSPGRARSRWSRPCPSPGPAPAWWARGRSPADPGLPRAALPDPAPATASEDAACPDAAPVTGRTGAAERAHGRPAGPRSERAGGAD